MVPVCDKRYHIYNRFRHFWAEIKKLWNYPLSEARHFLILSTTYILCARTFFHHVKKHVHKIIVQDKTNADRITNFTKISRKQKKQRLFQVLRNAKEKVIHTLKLLFHTLK